LVDTPLTSIVQLPVVLGELPQTTASPALLHVVVPACWQVPVPKDTQGLGLWQLPAHANWPVGHIVGVPLPVVPVPPVPLLEPTSQLKHSPNAAFCGVIMQKFS
jgi:hypothetical protein